MVITKRKLEILICEILLWLCALIQAYAIRAEQNSKELQKNTFF